MLNHYNSFDACDNQDYVYQKCVLYKLIIRLNQPPLQTTGEFFFLNEKALREKPLTNILAKTKINEQNRPHFCCH